MLREEVTETDVADIVSKWSGIPVRMWTSCATISHPIRTVNPCFGLLPSSSRACNLELLSRRCCCRDSHASY